jgi:hypothetical protein
MRNHGAMSILRNGPGIWGLLSVTNEQKGSRADKLCHFIGPFGELQKDGGKGVIDRNEILTAQRKFTEPEKSKESRFWLMAIEHSTSCLVDRDALTLLTDAPKCTRASN